MMEYAKDEVFSICYNLEKDKRKRTIKERMMNKIQTNRWLTFFVTMGVAFSILNCILIYYFFYLLNKI